MSDPNARSVREQVWGAADPTGQTRSLINAAVHGPAVPTWFSVLGGGITEAWNGLRAHGVEYQALLGRIEEALEVVVPHGWAVMQMDSKPLAEAVRLAKSGRTAEADHLLADQWDGAGAWRTRRVCDRVRVMGAGEEELTTIFIERARLLRLAKGHHDEGRYEASIPLLQAQMEGIVMDVAGGQKFFTKGSQKADLVDPTRLVSIEASLAALQATYGANVTATQIEGSLSRHGVAHGRELAYDTRVNSAKTWSVVDALVEWAMPRARALADERRAQRQATNAGSGSVDERGRRVDDREFSETREVLRLLGTSAMGWHRQQGCFRDDIVGRVYQEKDFSKKGLPGVDHGIRQQVSGDGQEVMYWRRTISGWVLGLDLHWTGSAFAERLFSGDRPPAGLPSSEGAGWGGVFGTPPDWS